MTAWYVARAGQQSGPMSRAELQQMAMAGQLGPDAWVAGPEVSGWVPAAQLFPPPTQPAWQQAPQPGAQQQLGVHQNINAQQAFPLGIPGQQPMPQQAFSPGVQGQFQAAAPGQPKGDWAKERLRGLGAIGIAVLLLILNVVSIVTLGRFFPKTLILGLGALGYGGWVVIFGDEYDDHTMQLVPWKRAGMWICGGLGAVLGIVLSIVIAD